MGLLDNAQTIKATIELTPTQQLQVEEENEATEAKDKLVNVIEAKPIKESYTHIPKPPEDLFDEEAERAVLGAMMDDNSVIPKVIELFGTNVQVFKKTPHQIIYGAIIKLYDKLGVADMLTVSSYIKEQGDLGRIGGETECYDLVHSTPSAVNAPYYAEIVLDKFKRRKLKDMGLAVYEMSRDTSQDYTSILDKVNSMMFDSSIDKRRDGFCLNDVLDEFTRRIQPGYQQIPGVMTGFNDLDIIFGPLIGGQVFVIAGRTSHSKSTMCHHIARHNIDKNIPVLYYSYEDSADVITARILCTDAEIPFIKAWNNKMNKEEQARYTNAINNLKDKPLRIYSKSLNLSELRASVRANMIEYKTDLVIVICDYLQQMIVSGKSYEDATMASKGVKQLAIDLQIPVYAVSQINRSSEYREDKMPKLNDLRASGCIEEDGHAVLIIHRPGKDDSTIEDTEIIFKLAKNKNGQLAEFSLPWNGSCMKIG